MNMDITQLLVWLVGGGCIIAASWILERIPQYTALNSQLKMWIFFGVSATLGIVAYVIGAFVPVEVIQGMSPYFAIIASVFSYVFLGTAFHRVDKQIK